MDWMERDMLKFTEEFETLVEETISKDFKLIANSNESLHDVYNDCAYTPLELLNDAIKLARHIMKCERLTSVDGINLSAFIKGCKGWEREKVVFYDK